MSNCKEKFNQLFEVDLDEELENRKLKLVDDSSTFESSNLDENSQTTNNILSFIREEFKLVKQEEEREREHFAKQIEV